jgi:hypothetical protein
MLQFVRPNFPCCSSAMGAHPDTYHVSTVRHIFIRAGKNAGNFVSDLIFVRGVPTIVLEWLVGPDDVTLPLVTISLDSRYLHKLNPPLANYLEAEYLYENEVVDPRRWIEG